MSWFTAVSASRVGYSRAQKVNPGISSPHVVFWDTTTYVLVFWVRDSRNIRCGGSAKGVCYSCRSSPRRHL